MEHACAAVDQVHRKAFARYVEKKARAAETDREIRALLAAVVLASHVDRQADRRRVEDTLETLVLEGGR